VEARDRSRKESFVAFEERVRRLSEDAIPIEEHSLRILVAEDMLGNRLLIDVYPQATSHVLTFVEDGAAADTKKIKSDSIALVKSVSCRETRADVSNPDPVLK